MRSKLSQISLGQRCYVVPAQCEVVAETPTEQAQFDLEAVFRSQYPRIARVIAGVVRDPARAEELAVEVFLKL